MQSAIALFLCVCLVFPSTPIFSAESNSSGASVSEEMESEITLDDAEVEVSIEQAQEEVSEQDSSSKAKGIGEVSLPPKGGPQIPKESTSKMPRRYAADLGGIRDYMLDLEAIDPHTFRILEGDINGLYGRELFARWGGLGILGAGLLVFVGGFTFFSTSQIDPLTSQRISTQPSIGAVGVGSGLLLTGLIVALFTAPSKDEITALVGKHNRYRPRFPLRIQKDQGRSTFNFNPDLFVPKAVQEKRNQKKREQQRGSKRILPNDS